MNRRTVRSACCLLAGTMCTVPALAASGATCFTEIEQDYDWSDGGFHWSAMPDRCPDSPQPASPAERAWGGSLKIRVSGAEASVVQVDYAWVPHRDGPAGDCPRFFRSVTTTTKVAKNGVLSETKQIDSEPPTTQQRILRGAEMLYIPSVQSVPRANDPFLQVVGEDTIAGQPCQRVAPKPDAPGAGTWQTCVYAALPDCRAARYLQPLELIMKGPDGQTVLHGRTTHLQVGDRGSANPDLHGTPEERGHD